MTGNAAECSQKEGNKMGWNYGPPMEPPTRPMRTCPECEGDAFITMEVEGNLEDVTCLDCDGAGEIEYDPSDNPWEPDNWKEAEGIA